jgi:hypothetical protein
MRVLHVVEILDQAYAAAEGGAAAGDGPAR